MHDSFAAEVAKRSAASGARHLIAAIESLNKNFALGAGAGVVHSVGLVLGPLFEHLAAAFEIFAAHCFVPRGVTREAPIKMTLLTRYSLCFIILHSMSRTAVGASFDERVFARVGHETREVLLKQRVLL